MITDRLPSQEQNIASIIGVAQTALKTILETSGTILYSSCETIRPGKYYFLGLNPGGTESDTNTIQKSLEELQRGQSTKNAYLDEDWSSSSRHYGAGGHPLQKNFECLFNELGEDPRTICASNLIFKRSGDERGAGYPELAKVCWPVHRAILDVVRPRAIITFGRQPFDFLAQQLGYGAVHSDQAGHGDWKWNYIVKEEQLVLIGVPHLSLYALRCHPEVIEKIRTLVM